MENASNALLIGAGILIGILVLSIGIYTYSNYSKVNNQYKQEQILEEINRFNSIFTAYLTRKDIKAQEIVTLKNLTKKYKDENDIEVTIDFTGPESSVIKTALNGDSINFLKTYSVKSDNSGPITFTCKNIEYDNTSGRVKLIVLKKNL